MIRLIYFIFYVCLFVFSTNNTAWADQSYDEISVQQWKTLPILHDGRLKPLDSFARVTLTQISGQDRLQDLNASQWLAEVFFAPERAILRPVFQVSYAENYEMKKVPKGLYSYNDISDFIHSQKEILQELENIPENSRSEIQKNLFSLYENYLIYTELLRSFTAFMFFDTPGQTFNQKKIKSSLDQKLKGIIQQKGQDPKNYTAEEKEIAARAFYLNLLQEGGAHNKIARLIPLLSENQTQWVSPWQIILEKDIKKTKAQGYFEIWNDLLKAYKKYDHVKWNELNKKAQSFLNDIPGTKIQKVRIETLHNGWNFFQLAFYFYCLCFSLMLLYFFSLKIPRIYSIACAVLTIGVFLHTIDIVLRVYLLERPPVGTLYESIIFVSLICAAGGLCMSYIQKTSTGFLMGSLGGLLLYLVSQSFSGHNIMGTLVAVLNTNFWLATHVLCITIGYGLCLLTSLAAHLNLGLRQFRNVNETLSKSLSEKNLKTMLILSLLFTATGTILGGIWADQSWGRFWGWDPKENGALLIVLWIVWILHSRLSGHLNQTGYIIGCAFLSVIVVFAWFGVNLLSVGLHSYGFTDGILWGIGLFTLFEAILISGLAFRKIKT